MKRPCENQVDGGAALQTKPEWLAAGAGTISGAFVLQETAFHNKRAACP